MGAAQRQRERDINVLKKEDCLCIVRSTYYFSINEDKRGVHLAVQTAT